MVKIAITGKPGIGKTTIVKKLLKYIEADGFYTEEVRRGGKRIGFSLITTWGEIYTLAHVDFRGPYRVSKYGVDISVLDRVVERLEKSDSDFFVIDEIGKMELFSLRFRKFIENNIFQKNYVVTVPLRSRDPLVERIKETSHLIEITLKNREFALENLILPLLFST